ncbi:TIGR04283 family arsenosugar biosynthesis glycosyltransferase [Marinobacter orientalis]|uniref:Glycosyltransferase family 2 protein n=1 Tax=Marinobacter orientalis TaxID=1928859 RepID=A0A7Y0WS41_9GAMM|nr:TIGR04283 family arsenosugar biosynthesis glycosyltransferase [Marinobacter orientalis]NMT63549.1 glycosyltransferase family 2 protein [Marinobacter orientalis]TGX48605.1 glycosyltransferase [Marinobacter orientalis]
MSESLSLSVIVPVWHEAATIQSFLQSLQPVRMAGHEVIVVDGCSDDGTADLAAPWCDQVLTCDKGRALQMNAGADATGGNVLLFLHADTLLPAAAIDHLERFFSSPEQWGRFDVRLSGQRAIFRVVAWFMNKRSRLTGIATGDQAMFVRTPVFRALQGFAPIPLMEDVELSKRLCSLSRPYCIKEPVTTDSRRWEHGGAWRTIFLMWRLRWRYWRGESPESLAAAYRADVRHAKS